MRQPMQYVDGLGRDIPGPLFPIVDAYTTLRAVLLAKCKFERKMERKSSPHRIHLSVVQLFFSSAKVRSHKTLVKTRKCQNKMKG
jgi:hypothetical protein